MEKLDTLTYSYPKQETPNIQTLISEKKEFADLALPRDIERLASRGDLYKHQKFGVLYANIYDQIFINHEPGTGKTAYGWAIGESFRKNSVLSPVEAYANGVTNWIRKMIILVPGDNVETSWRSSFHKHSDLKHIPSFYTIEHYGTFYNKFHTDGYLNPDAAKKIKEELDNTAIYIDEVHEMLIRSKAEKGKETSDYGFEIDELETLPELSEQSERKRYDFFRWAFSISENIKLFLATGTPIITSPIELAYIMNLFPGVSIPTLSDKTKSVKWFDIKNVDKMEQEIKGYVVGKISHVTNKKRDAIIIWPEKSKRVGTKDSKEYYNVVEYKMSPEQTALYRESFKTSGEFNVGPLQASVYATESKKGKKQPTTLPTLETIYKHGTKLKALQTIVNKHLGIKFIVSSWISSGVDRVEQVLKAAGLQLYGGSKGRPSFPSTKARRFIVIRSKKAYRSVLEMVNRPENVMGEYIEAVVTSDVGSISLSIHNVQTYIALGPTKHQSDEKQRISRILRPKSHEDLVAYRRSQLEDKKLRGEKITPEDEDLTVKIMAYYMVAVPADKDLKIVDLEIYKNNIEKEKPLEIVRTVINRLAVDAQINYERNQLNCTYNEDENCEYGFSDKAPKGGLGGDRSTYDLLHGGDEVQPLIRELVDVLLQELSVDIDDFWNRKPRDIPQIPFFRVLTKIIRSNISILTTTGEYCMLKAVGNSIVITTNGDEDTSIYPMTHSIYRSNTTIATIGDVDSETTSPDYDTVEKLAAYLDIPSVKGHDYVSKKIPLIEKILINGDEGENKKFYEYIMNRYSKGEVYEDNGELRKGGLYIFNIPKPLNYLKELSNAKTKAKRIKMAENLNEIQSSTGETVLVHTFWAQKGLTNNSKFNLFTYHMNAKILSVFDPQIKTFVMLEPASVDQLAYSIPISKIIKKKYEDFIQEMIDRKVAFAKKRKPALVQLHKLLDASEKSNSETPIKDFANKVHDMIINKKLEKNPGEIWGAKFDPEMMFRINDARKDVPDTKENKKSKNKESRTKQNQSYEMYEYCDIAVFLGMSDGIYDNADKIALPKINAKTGKDWLNEIERVANIKADITSTGVEKTVEVGKKRTDSAQIKAIRSIKTERLEYYDSPDAVDDGKLLYILFQLHIGKNPYNVVKKQFAEKVERFLYNIDHFYHF